MAEGFKKMVNIGGRALMSIRGEGPKNDKGSHRSMKTKKLIRIYLREVSDI